MSDPQIPHPVIDGTTLEPGEAILVYRPGSTETTTPAVYRGTSGPRLALIGNSQTDKPRVMGFSVIAGRVTPLASPGVPIAVSATRLRAIVDDFRPLASTRALREILARLEAL
jgi:hypothetical protein